MKNIKLLENLIAQGHRSAPQIYLGDKLFVEGGYQGLAKLSDEDQPSRVKTTKKGLISLPKLRVTNILTEKQKVEFFKDYKAGVSSSDLLEKYKFNTLGAVYHLIHKLRRISSEKDTVVKKVSNPAPSVVVPKIVTTSIRTIKFPDGFVIQIEKAFISGVLIHENGNITIIK